MTFRNARVQHGELRARGACRIPARNGARGTVVKKEYRLARELERDCLIVGHRATSETVFIRNYPTTSRPVVQYEQKKLDNSLAGIALDKLSTKRRHLRSAARSVRPVARSLSIAVMMAIGSTMIRSPASTVSSHCSYCCYGSYCSTVSGQAHCSVWWDRSFSWLLKKWQ